MFFTSTHINKYCRRKNFLRRSTQTAFSKFPYIYHHHTLHHAALSFLLKLISTIIACIQVCSWIRTDLSHIWPPPFWPDNSQPWRLFEKIQRDPILGCHRNLHGNQFKQTCWNFAKIHQTCCIVRAIVSYKILLLIILLFIVARSIRTLMRFVLL